MITLQNANSYFKAHTLGARWAEYSGDQRSAAILQARRDLSKALGRAMREDEPPYRDGDRRRDEYAVYEQAAYILLRDVHPEGSGEAVPALDGNGVRDSVPQAFGHIWSRAAILWLGDVVNTTITC